MTNKSNVLGLTVSQLASVISVAVVLLGLAWTGASWQTTINGYILEARERDVKMINAINKHSLLLEDITMRLAKIESEQDRSFNREDFLFWILALKDQNPDIKLPPPTLDDSPRQPF